MNKTKIDWADYTWNPVTGCLNTCEYCYAGKMQELLYDLKMAFEKEKPVVIVERESVCNSY